MLKNESIEAKTTTIVRVLVRYSLLARSCTVEKVECAVGRYPEELRKGRLFVDGEGYPLDRGKGRKDIGIQFIGGRSNNPYKSCREGEPTAPQ